MREDCEDTDMSKKKTSELSGAALDCAVAQAAGVRVKIQSGICYDAELLEMEADGDTRYLPSEEWEEGGPIIEREGLALYKTNGGDWVAQGVYDFAADRERPKYHGPTILTAAMRCYVASKLGDEVEIPEELA